MIEKLKSAVIALSGATTLLLTSPLHAQIFGQATPLAASDPVRMKAESLAKLIFEGNLREATDFLKLHAEPSSPAAADPAGQIGALAKSFGAGGFKIQRAAQMAPGEVLVYASNATNERAALVVSFNPAEPFRLKEVSSVEINSGRNPR